MSNTEHSGTSYWFRIGLFVATSMSITAGIYTLANGWYSGIVFLLLPAAYIYYDYQTDSGR